MKLALLVTCSFARSIIALICPATSLNSSSLLTALCHLFRTWGRFDALLKPPNVCAKSYTSCAICLSSAAVLGCVPSGLELGFDSGAGADFFSGTGGFTPAPAAFIDAAIFALTLAFISAINSWMGLSYSRPTVSNWPGFS